MHKQSEDSQETNLKVVRLVTYADYFIVEQDVSEFNGKKGGGLKMIIERQSNLIYEIESDVSSGEEKESEREFSGLLGMVEINQRMQLVMCETVKRVCEIEGEVIFQMGSPVFIDINSQQPLQQLDQVYHQSEQAKDTLYQVQKMQKLLSQGYYFSFSYDLTLNQQKRSNNSDSHYSFIWNNHLFEELRKQNVGEEWFTPIMQGFIGRISKEVAGNTLEYLLISRRSCKRAGTRYNARGIDDQGHVANYVETEQMVRYGDTLISHVQVRGSVPLFFEQTGITAQTQLTRNFEMTHNIYEKHLGLLVDSYKKVLCVNLMAKHKKGEQLLTEEFEKHVQKQVENDKCNISGYGNTNENELKVRYEYFDFHQACQGEQFQHSNSLIKKLRRISNEFGFYMEDAGEKSIIKQQQGVIRTNCLDCLDRTNYVQTKLGAVALEGMLQSLEKTSGVSIRKALYLKENEEYRELFGLFEEIDMETDLTSDFVGKFKHCWADNGDGVSMHYTGTGSTHTNITREGRRNFMGVVSHKMKSISRLYMQLFEDHLKQDSINQLLGLDSLQTDIRDQIPVYDDYVMTTLERRAGEYTEQQQLEVLVVNWNLHGGQFLPSRDYQLNHKIFNLPSSLQPDVLFIALQQVGSAQSTQEQWQACLLFNLQRLNNYTYVLVEKKHLNGVLSYLFCKQAYIKRISRLNVQTHLFSHSQSKGAINISFAFDDSQMNFLNCELDDQNLSNRLQDFDEMHTQLHGDLDSWKVNQDYCILAGSLHFQLLLQQTESIHLAEKLEYIDTLIKQIQIQTSKELNEKLKNELEQRLLKFDELIQSKECYQQFYQFLHQYKEAQIMFLPPSLYNKYSVLYKQNNDQFQVSYNQRVLFWSLNSQNVVKQYLYTAKANCIESQNRPVLAYYSIPVKKQIQQKRDQIIKQIYLQLRKKEESHS